MNTSRAKLRTKSGCFTCRKRRRKCDEQHPRCLGCSFSHLQCVWPAKSDMSDRRNRRASSSNNNKDDLVVPSRRTQPILTLQDRAAHSSKIMTIGRNPTYNTTISATCDLFLLDHYLGGFIQTLLLPNADPRFYTAYRSYVMLLAFQCPSVKYAILACCASNKFMLTGEYDFQRMALNYYSQALQLVNETVSQLNSVGGSPDDPLLVSVIYMYIFALWGPDAPRDAHKHVAGAQKLLKLRYADRKSQFTVAEPFDRMTAESVLYQSFLLAMRDPFSLGFHSDSEFLTRTTQLLKSLTFLDASETANSPILGAPLALYELIANIIRLFNSPCDRDLLTKSRKDMAYWEQLLFRKEPMLHDKNDYWDMVQLYVLAASLLLDWITESNDDEESSITPLQPGATSAFLSNCSPLSSPCLQQLQPVPWQASQAFAALRQPGMRNIWTQCYLATWPLLIFGYAAQEEEDIEIVRDLLHESCRRLGYGEMGRIRDELEIVWKARRPEICHDGVDRPWDDADSV